ncbi:MAG: hypothetical protein ACLFT4_00195 [Bacteroidales bacterium]
MRLKHFINRIVKGLVTDIAKSMFPNDAAYKIENAVLVNKDGDDFIITTKRGNRLDFTLPDGLVPIGFKVYDDILYIVSYEEVDGEKRYEIGSYPSPRKLVEVSNPDNTGSLIHDFVQCYSLDDSLEGYENEYKPIPMAKGTYDGNEYLFGFTTTKIAFNKNYIDILPRKSYDGSVDLFICDGENYNRTINTGFIASKILKDRLPKYDNTFIEHEKITRQFLSVNKPVHSDFEVEQGGRLRYGRLFFYIRYLDTSFNPTNWYPMEGPVQISYGSKYHDIHGGDPENDIPTDKQVKFTLSNLDTAFRYFEIGVFYERGQASATPPVKKAYLIHNRYEIDGDERELLITGREEEAVLTPEELIMPATKETISLSHTHHNKRYFGARWKRKRFDKEFIDNLARRIYIVPDISKSNESDNSDPFLINFEDDNLVRNQDPHYGSAFYPGEVVGFAIVCLMDDGTFSKPAPITGFNNFYQHRINNGGRYNIETHVSINGTGTTHDDKMLNWLTDDDNRKKGLFGFPMLGTNEDGIDPFQGLDKMERKLKAKIKLKYAHEYYQDNLEEFENAKSVYIVRTDEFKNTEYMGLAYAGYDRFRLDRENIVEDDTPGATANHRRNHFIGFGKGYYYAGHGYWEEEMDYSGVYQNNIREILGPLAMPLHGPSGMPFFSTGIETAYGVFNTKFYNPPSVSEIRPIGVQCDERGASRHPTKRGKYGLFSSDFLLSSDRPLTDNMEYFVSKIANYGIESEVSTFRPLIGSFTYPHSSGWQNFALYSKFINRINGSDFWNVKKGRIVNVEKNVYSKHNFSSVFGDQILSTDFKSAFYDNQSTKARSVADSISDLFRGFRNPEVRTSPYLGLKVDIDNYYKNNWGDNQILIISKRDPLMNFDMVLNDFNENENIKYYLCSKPIDFSGVPVLYNGDGLTTGKHISVVGNAFFSRSFIRTRYNELFEDMNYKDAALSENQEYTFQDSHLQFAAYENYISMTHELLSFPSYTWNNVSMQSGFRKDFYPFGMKEIGSKSDYCRGFRRDKSSLGIEPVLDGSYNRHVFPNEFIVYPDYYKDDFEFNGRVRYSPQYRDGAYRDSWRNIPPIQYTDFDLAYGFISGILNVLGRLVLIHAGAIYQLFSDQREIKQSETGTELTLGLGGVLEDNRKPLTEMFGSELPVFENGLAGAYGISLSKNKLWQITQVEGGGLSVNDLSLQYKIEDDVRETLSVLDSYELISDVFSNKIDIGYSESESCVYFSVLKRENKAITIESRGDNIYRIYADPEDYDIMGVESLFLNFGNGWGMYDIVDLGVDYVEVNYEDRIPPEQFLSDDKYRIHMFATKGKTYVYDETMKYFHTIRSVPDHWISGKNISAVKRNPIDLNNEEIPEVGIFVSDEDANYGEFFGIINEMRVGVIINAVSSEEGLNSIQKMFISSKVTSDEEDFIRALFSTEFQQSYLFPFLNEMRFWELPYYSENKWEFNIPAQRTGSQGHERNAQMRGIWMKLELHYRGDSKKYIKDIITKVSPSYS